MRKIYISEKAHNSLKKYLENKNYSLSYVTCNHVDDAIACHPDLLICHLGSELFYGNSEKLQKNYPEDIRYNCACTGKYFIHNLKYTDDQLLARAKELNMHLVHVKQGYSKCNVVVVSQNAIITSDMGIYKVCKDLMNVLLISPGQILLPGMNTGFLGGTSGRVGNEIIFNGDLSKHKDFASIINFIENEGLKAVWFEDAPLIDIGSIISDEIYI